MLCLWGNVSLWFMYEENLFGGRASIEQDLNCIIY